MRRAFLIALISACSASASAHTCNEGTPVKIEGDAPGAISYDIYSQLYPLTPAKLARFSVAQQVQMIPDGTKTCTISDDGVADPGPVLVNGPRGQMNYWISDSYVRPAV